MYFQLHLCFCKWTCEPAIRIVIWLCRTWLCLVLFLNVPAVPWFVLDCTRVPDCTWVYIIQYLIVPWFLHDSTSVCLMRTDCLYRGVPNAVPDLWQSTWLYLGLTTVVPDCTWVCLMQYLIVLCLPIVNTWIYLTLVFLQV